MTDTASSLARPAPQVPGALLALAGGTCFSLGALLVRAAEEAGIWQILFWRSLALGLFFTGILAWRYRGDLLRPFREMGGAAVLGGFALGMASATFIFALTLTTAFNALLMLCSSPLLAAALGRLVLKERVRAVTWLAILVALIGVGIMVWDGLRLDSVLGNLLAFGSALGFATYTVILRQRRTQDSLPAVIWSAGFVIVLSAAMAFAGGLGLAINLNDLALCAAQGFLQVGVGFLLYNAGSRRLPAAEATLLSLSEVLLGPVWVWLAFGEVPTELGFIGGAVLLTAIVIQALFGLRRREAVPVP